jgi:hypothetical protein
MRVKERTGGMAVEFTSIISLESENGKVEVVLHKHMKTSNSCKGIGFVAQGKSPREVAIIIQQQ